jgi:nucleoside-diphosphate-sugar epimerase
MRCILLTGVDGYVGWATALKLSRKFPEARIVGVDNLARREWVQECGSISAVPVHPMEERLEAAGRHGFDNIRFIPGDLTDRDFVKRLFALHAFDSILHLAAQPSAPYSQIDGERANFTQFNNNQSLRNLLWGLKESGRIDACEVIASTTTGVYGAPAFPIPEGFVTAEHKGVQDTIPFGGMAGSWYHMSKHFDCCNLWLANMQWGATVADMRTAIVYGAQTRETSLAPELATRFDFDFNFGIVVNRFCAMALTGHPITVYGKGEQKKPFISLEDCAKSFVELVGKCPKSAHTVYNQYTETVSIADMAYGLQKAAEGLGVGVDIEHIPNPRVESEDHKMEMDNKRFLELLGTPRLFADELPAMLDVLVPLRETIHRFKSSFLR